MRIKFRESDGRQIQHWISNIRKLGEAWKMLINREAHYTEENLQVHRESSKVGLSVFFLRYAISIGSIGHNSRELPQ